MAEDDQDMEGVAGARTFWTGTITFGLVSVPVSLFAATRNAGVALRMVSEEGTPLQRRYVCSKDGKELDWDEIVRGYEVSKGKFVVVTDDELEAIAPRKSREIDLRLFVPLEEIDPKYFERGYFLAPAGGSSKAYRLLAEVMEKSGRAGVATFVMRAREYVVAIIAEEGLLRAETLRFPDELRTPAGVGLPKIQKPKAAEQKKFEQAIAHHKGKVDFREFTDAYAERLQALVAKKEKSGKGVVKTKVEETPEESGADVIDLMSALRRSLQGGGSATRRSPRAAKTKRPAARKAK